MATFVFFHAHPDDEAIGTAGTMAAAAHAGHRVVAVFATRGERGDVPGDLAGHGTLGALREAEAHAAGRILGAARVAFLGYEDSGMLPEDVPDEGFAAADVDVAGARLAALLAEEAADALVIYDPTGATKHPDHLQVHRVGCRAAELAGPGGPRVYEAVIAASQLARLVRQVTPEGAPDVEVGLFAVPDSELTTVVEVGPWLATKRAAMAAHASQIPPDSWFLTLPDDQFAAIWGSESYVDRAAGHAGPGPLDAAVGDLATAYRNGSPQKAHGDGTQPSGTQENGVD